MKSSSAFKILAGVVLAAVLFYFGVQIYRYAANPFTTTLTYETTADDSIAVTGWIVRDEETFHSDAATLTHSLGEGQKVGAGQVIATAYESSRALETVTEIENLKLQLQQMEYALVTYLDADAALKLDSSITNGILALRQGLTEGDYSAADDNISALKAAVLKSTHTYSSAEEIRADITAVQDRLLQLENSLSGAQRITAERSGIYSAVCDGYESVLTPDALSELTPGTLDRLTPSRNTGNVGKLIYGETWYYAANVDAALTKNLSVGQTLILRLAKGLSQDAVVTVRSVSGEEDGKVTVVLSCREYLPQTTLLRHQAAELILRSYQGLRVPTTSLRLDADGQTGVYCVVGVSARFKPVDLLYRSESFSLVRPVSEATGSAVLRPGDEIIITANKLENGVVVR
ncbi:MAG: hypothetical protein IJL08_04595 [Oscillospiraceae bacterium]|nr:hypothetical protein [Oscillospiraceae bacterium]